MNFACNAFSFSHRLFTDSPELLPLFSFRDIDLSNEAARSDKRLRRQGLATMQYVDLAVSSLNDLGSIVPTLKDLGARHVMYNVKDHHYEVGNRLKLKNQQVIMNTVTYTEITRKPIN